MIEVPVSDAILLQSRDLAEEMGRIRNSFTNGQGNVAGFIGELVVLELLKGKRVSTKDYDIILEDGTTLDVKTKRTSVKPLPHYDCSVAELSLHQNCDAYAFCRVKNDYTVCWMLGMVMHDTYFSKARYLKKGDVDPSNNYTVKSSCYNLSIEELERVDISAGYRNQSEA